MYKIIFTLITTIIMSSIIAHIKKNLQIVRYHLLCTTMVPVMYPHIRYVSVMHPLYVSTHNGISQVSTGNLTDLPCQHHGLISIACNHACSGGNLLNV